MVALAVQPSSAGAISLGGSTPIGVSPPPLQNGQAPPYFEFTLGPGDTSSSNVIISNEGTRSETLKLSGSTGITSPNSGSAFEGSFDKCVGVGCWVSGLPPKITLQPGARETVPFTVSVPSATGPRQYLAGITVEPNTPSPRVTVGSNGKASASAVIVDQVTVGVAVTVGSISALTTRLQISGVTGGAVGSAPRMYVKVRNSGQTFAKAAGTASCALTGRQVSYAISSDTVLPGDSALLPVNAPGLEPGAAVPCHVQLSYDPTSRAEWTGKVVLPTTPPTTVVRTGLGTYSSVSTGMPAWAIALIVIGALIVVALGVITMLLLRRREAHGNPSG